MPDYPTYRLSTPAFLFLSLLAGMAACGLLGSDDQQGGLLSVTPVSAVEVMLEVRAAPGTDVSIKRGGTEIFSFTMQSADTLLTDSGLAPSTSYTWSAVNHTGRRNRVIRQAATMDTTSGDFTWQKFEFGDYSASSIKDVAIINENNIWAVGEIYMNDSTGNPDYTPYNAVHWDGKEWKILRVPFDSCGAVKFPPIRTIFAFNEHDIWFARGGSLTRFNGQEYTNDCRMNSMLDGSINKIWGRSSEDFYIVANVGNIAHYNGERWQKLESGTSLNINDIWGSKNPHTGKWEVLAVAYNSFSSNAKRVLHIEQESVAPLPVEGLGPGMYAIWFEAGRRYFVGGNDLYQTFDPEKSWETNTLFQPGFRGSKAAVRGNSLNDIVVVGTHGLVMHFNGTGWQHYEDQLLLNPAGSYTSLDVKGDIIVAGGGHEGKGLVLIGRRE